MMNPLHRLVLLAAGFAATSATLLADIPTPPTAAAAVPEPATWALMALGTALLIGVDRKRRRRR